MIENANIFLCFLNEFSIQDRQDENMTWNPRTCIYLALYMIYKTYQELNYIWSEGETWLETMIMCAVES